MEGINTILMDRDRRASLFNDGMNKERRITNMMERI